MVLAVVILVELQNGFSGSLAQPDDGIDLTLAVPFYFPNHPRGANAGQVRCRCEVDVEHGVGMLLEVGRRNVGIRLPLDGAFDYCRLMLAGRDERDLTRLHDRGNAHRDRFRGHVVFTEEIPRRIAASDGVERNATGA